MDLSKKQLTEIVTGCIGNKRSAQEALYRLFYTPMLRVCSRYLKSPDTATDAVNEGFLKIFQNIGAFNAEKGELGAWIRTIMIRTSIDYRRKELKFSTETYEDQHTDEYSIDPQVLAKLYAEDMYKSILQLPDATQVVFNLSVIEGYPHKEIAEQLQITESTSRWHLTEAKKKLRALLQIDNETGESTKYDTP